MKKTYITPSVEKIAFNYSRQVVASNAESSCYWKNNGFWSYGSPTCHETYVEGSATQVPA